MASRQASHSPRSEGWPHREHGVFPSMVLAAGFPPGPFSTHPTNFGGALDAAAGASSAGDSTTRGSGAGAGSVGATVGATVGAIGGAAGGAADAAMGSASGGSGEACS